MENETKYCPKCGKKLITRNRTETKLGFSRITGKPVIGTDYELVCPDYSSIDSFIYRLSSPLYGEWRNNVHYGARISKGYFEDRPEFETIMHL